MNMAKVWNDNELPFKQTWKERDIFIPAKSYIEMEYDDAHAFKSYPHPIEKDGMGQQLKSSYKMIRVEGRPGHDVTVVAYRSQVDGSPHANQQALEAHDAQFSHRQIVEMPSEQLDVTAKKPSKKA